MPPSARLRKNSGCVAPAFAICSVRFASFHTANTIATYCDERWRSCSESFSSASISAGGRCAAPAERMMPLTSAAYKAAGAALPLTSPTASAVRSLS